MHNMTVDAVDCWLSTVNAISIGAACQNGRLRQTLPSSMEKVRKIKKKVMNLEIKIAGLKLTPRYIFFVS